MPKGLKQTSSLITIGARVTETGPNTFTQATVDLQLNPLDNEVFVVQAIDMDNAAPDAARVEPKPKRRKKNPKLKKALQEANRRLRLKNGSLRKGKTQSDIMKMAHKLMKKM